MAAAHASGSGVRLFQHHATRSRHPYDAVGRIDCEASSYSFVRGCAAAGASGMSICSRALPANEIPAAKSRDKLRVTLTTGFVGTFLTFCSTHVGCPRSDIERGRSARKGRQPTTPPSAVCFFSLTDSALICKTTVHHRSPTSMRE